MSKNIHDLSDDEFDDLFRDSAEKSDIDFDPEAWNKMSKKLDAATVPPSSPGIEGSPLRKRILPSLIVLLLLITGTYFLLRKPSEALGEAKVKEKESSLKKADLVDKKYVTTDKVDTENQKIVTEASDPHNKTKEEKAHKNNSRNDKLSINESLSTDKLRSAKEEKSLSVANRQKEPDKNGTGVVETPSIKQEKEHHSKNQQKTTGIKPDLKAVSNARADTENKSVEVQSQKSEPEAVTSGHRTNRKSQTEDIIEGKTDRTGKIAKAMKPSSAFEETGANNNQTQSVKLKDSNSANTIDGSLKTSAQNQGLVIDSVNAIGKMQWGAMNILSPARHLSVVNLELPPINFESSFLTPSSKPRENTAFRRGLNIRLALSPDFSFIPSNTLFKIGNNWAAIIEYRINNRISIQSGVIRSMKLYNALPSQYEWNSYWTMPSPLKDIDATCKMLDIPLNVRYDITQKPNSRWFVGAGLTSYIMLKEEYIYNYENPADPNIKRRYWEGKTGWYPFSVLNLSTGYEHQVFRRLTFQAEPFFKAPLGKVGYGKVRLATAGVFFSVKYPF